MWKFHTPGSQPAGVAQDGNVSPRHIQTLGNASMVCRTFYHTYSTPIHVRTGTIQYTYPCTYMHHTVHLSMYVQAPYSTPIHVRTCTIQYTYPCTYRHHTVHLSMYIQAPYSTPIHVNTGTIQYTYPCTYRHHTVMFVHVPYKNVCNRNLELGGCHSHKVVPF